MEDNWPKAWPNVVSSVDEVYTFDPDGDVLLLLQKTIAKASTIRELTPDDAPQESETANGENAIPRVTSPSAPPADENPQEFQQPIRAEEDLILGESALQLELEDETVLEETLHVYLRVSSRHLILASPIFKKMLGSDTFAEGNTLRSQGNLSLELFDDPEALIILMYIVHGMTRNVPRNINLDTLAKLAKLVDYYELHEIVELFSDTWVANLKQKAFPESYNPEIVPWLFISWVFHKGDVFQEMTKILACESDDRLLDDVEHEKFPVPPGIISKIQEHRNEAIERIITIVHDCIDKYLISDTICSKGGQFACDANVLGSLLKSSAAIGIWPRPKIPYRGIKFNILASKVREMRILDSCSQQDRYRDFGNNGHSIKDTIIASTSSLEDLFCGLKLDIFLPETQSKKKGGKAKKKWGGKKKKKKGKGSITWEPGSDPIDEVAASITLLS